MNRKKLLQSKREGSAMALVLIALVVLLVTGVGLLSLGLHSRILALRDASDIAARCAADAGLTKALFEMNEKLNVKPWDDSTLPQATNEVLPNCDATFSYTVTVNSGSTGDGDSQGEDDQGEDDQGEDDQGEDDQGEDGDSGYVIVSVGKYGQAVKQVSCNLGLEGPFDSAILCNDQILLRSGTTIDGYNFESPGECLKIGTNSIEAGSIVAKTGVTIFGDVFVGPGGDPDVVIDTKKEAVITGETYAMPEEYELPSIMVPQYLQEMPSQGVLTNPTTPISSSAKYDSINLGNSVIATIDGAVTLYVTGDVILDNSAQLLIVDANTNPDASLTLYLGGNILAQNGAIINNMTYDPTRLKVYGLDTYQSIDIKTNSVFYGAIYAPTADVRLYNSVEVYGAIIGKSFSQDVFAAFHYDASLKAASISDEMVSFVIRQWHEE